MIDVLVCKVRLQVWILGQLDEVCRTITTRTYENVVGLASLGFNRYDLMRLCGAIPTCFKILLHDNLMGGLVWISHRRCGWRGWLQSHHIGKA